MQDKLKVLDNLQQYLDNLNYSDVTIEEIGTILNNAMDKYEMISVILQPGSIFHRGIGYTTKPEYFTELIYPPIEKTKLNRANIAGEQVFYASSSRRAVFYELNVLPTSKLVLSTWLTTDGLLFNSIGFTFQSLSVLGSNNIESKVISIGDFGNKPISDYLGNYFSQPINTQNAFLYKGTNALAKILYGDHRMAGILYPTVKNNGNEDNFAIKKHIIDKGFLELDRVEFVEIVSINNGRYQYKILDIGTRLSNGKIEWKGNKNTWTLYDDSEEIYFHKENDVYKAYSLDGERIDSD